MLDLKLLIGLHSREFDHLPRVDKVTVKAVLETLKDANCTVTADMSPADWCWWRVMEHVREVNCPTSSVRDWVKLEPDEEDEPRVMETCEALRQHIGGPCPHVEPEQKLYPCKGVSKSHPMI